MGWGGVGGGVGGRKERRRGSKPFSESALKASCTYVEGEEGRRYVNAGRCALLLATSSFFSIIVLLQPFYFAESLILMLLMPSFSLSSAAE